jgi:hypothetical protein
MQQFFKTITIMLSVLLIGNSVFAATATIPQQPEQGIKTESIQTNETVIAQKIWKSKLKSNFQNVKSYLSKALPEEVAKMDGLAVAGFICGLVSLLIAGIILGILGIIFSAIALGRINKSGGTRKGRGLAIAGLILGIIGVIGALIFISTLTP